MIPSVPPLIVAPAAFVTSAVPARMPNATPEIVPPLTLFTMTLVAWMALLFAPVASILPALAVTLTFWASIVFTPFDRIVPVLVLFTLTVSVAAMAPETRGFDYAGIGGDIDGPSGDAGAPDDAAPGAIVHDNGAADEMAAPCRCPNLAGIGDVRGAVTQRW